MESSKIILVDGTEYEGKYSVMAGQLYLYLTGVKLKEVYPYVSDENNVSTIRYANGTDITEITGYTKLFDIKQENEDLVSVGFLRG